MSKGASASASGEPESASWTADAPLVEILQETLAGLADCEAAFTERFYARFFEVRPDVRPLFGAHSIAEQEEMMRETLRSLLALSEEAEWLPGNLSALGRSHWEYGVTTDMYGDFVAVLLVCAEEILGDAFSEGSRDALSTAAEAISGQMARAGEEAACEAG